MSEAVDLASIYEDILLTTRAVARQSIRTSAIGYTSPDEIVAQCNEVDECWVELGCCVQKWKGYDVRFIATRFCNMHYVRATHVGNAYPDEAVWQHVVRRIKESLTGHVTIRLRSDTCRRVASWQ